MSTMGSFFNLSPLNTTMSRKPISFSNISAVNLMVGWNLEFVEFVATSAKTRNSSLFSRIFFFRSLDVHVGKKRKGDQSELEAKWLAQQSFPFQTRGEIERANAQTSSPGVSKTILLPSSPLQRSAVGGEGNLFLLPQTTLCSRFCCLSAPATQASKTKQNLFSVN